MKSTSSTAQVRTTIVLLVWVSTALAQSTWVEFQATERSEERNLLTGMTHTLRESVGWRKDGSHVRIRELANGVASGLRTVVEFQTAKRTVVDPLTESITTYPLPAQAVARMRIAPQQCASISGGTVRAILGFETVQVVFNDPAPTTLASGNPAPLLYQEQWVAPSLNCYPLLTITTVIEDGKEISKKVTEVLDVKLAPLPDSLFAIPSLYSERSPSAVLDEYDRRRHSDRK